MDEVVYYAHFIPTSCVLIWSVLSHTNDKMYHFKQKMLSSPDNGYQKPLSNEKVTLNNPCIIKFQLVMRVHLFKKTIKYNILPEWEAEKRKAPRYLGPSSLNPMYLDLSFE